MGERGDPRPGTRQLLSATILSVGTELTAGETRDTNAGDLARSLTDAGVRVVRLQALPDDLASVADAFARGLSEADLVVSTGGLGPTPDDLTREAIASVSGEEPVVAPPLEEWLRGLWARRGLAFSDINLKQAWLIPSATALSNEHGTAPGWWVDRPDGRVIVALPGPPREMRPMWHDALGRLRARGLGREADVRTLRLTGIGESQVADLLGEPLLRARNPEVATYARADAVDVRIAAVSEPGLNGTVGRTAVAVADEAEAAVLATLGEYVWARGSETWPEAIGSRLVRLGWRLAMVEIATAGALVGLLGELPSLVRAEVRPALAEDDEDVATIAADARRAGADVGLGIVAREWRGDTRVEVAVATEAGIHRERRVAFLGGPQGRSRAALAAAAILLAALDRAIAFGTRADTVSAAGSNASEAHETEEAPR